MKTSSSSCHPNLLSIGKHTFNNVPHSADNPSLFEATLLNPNFVSLPFGVDADAAGIDDDDGPRLTPTTRVGGGVKFIPFQPSQLVPRQLPIVPIGWVGWGS